MKPISQSRVVVVLAPFLVLALAFAAATFAQGRLAPPIKDLPRPVSVKDPLVYLPPCDIAIIGAAARALIGPDVVGPVPVDPAPEFCEGRVCTAHRDAVVARERAARALVEYQRWRALDHAILACGY